MRKNSSKKHGVNSLLNRSQSAMEYLMTYGWAILIIAIVLVALFSLGIFNSSNFAPRAQPGSCEVLRNSAQTSLVGQCNGMLPEYVAQFSLSSNTEIAINQVKQPLQEATVVAWVKPKVDQNGAFGGVIFSWYQNSQYTTIGVHSADGSGWCWMNGGGCGWIGATYNNWFFIAMTLSSTTGAVKIYLNNRPSQNATLPTETASSTSNMAIGYQLPANLRSFNGSITNVQLYNTSLSQSEIQALYKEGIGGAPINVNNLVGWWPLNGNANDYSGNDNNGVPTNVTYTSAWTSGYSAP